MKPMEMFFLSACSLANLVGRRRAVEVGAK